MGGMITYFDILTWILAPTLILLSVWLITEIRNAP